MVETPELSVYQLIQRILRSVEELEHQQVMTYREALVIRSTMVLVRGRILFGRAAKASGS